MSLQRISQVTAAAAAVAAILVTAESPTAAAPRSQRAPAPVVTPMTGCTSGAGGGFALVSCIGRSGNTLRPDFYVDSVPQLQHGCSILAYLYRNGELILVRPYSCDTGHYVVSTETRRGVYRLRIAAYNNRGAFQAEATQYASL